jgi:tRNA (Thr-GGU) A37 N-methylase
MGEIIYRPIGVIHTPFKDVKGTPNQPTAGKDVKGIIEIQPEYTEGLNDIEGFSHIIFDLPFSPLRWLLTEG